MGATFPGDNISRDQRNLPRISQSIPEASHLSIYLVDSNRPEPTSPLSSNKPLPTPKGRLPQVPNKRDGDGRERKHYLQQWNEVAGDIFASTDNTSLTAYLEIRDGANATVPWEHARIRGLYLVGLRAYFIWGTPKLPIAKTTAPQPNQQLISTHLDDPGNNL
jgi:hypothetical protein